MQSCDLPQKKISYHLNENNEFIVENYNDAKPFSSFLPGIAGILGIPMWIFYVNRGQCISTMGITNKDNAILEFFPANRAYQLTPLQGFRTFFKIGSANPIFYEPFQNNLTNAYSHTWQKMIITPYDFSIIDHNDEIGLETNVNYFTIANETFPALARVVTIKNISGKKLDMKLLDGLPFIIAHGLLHILTKDISRTAEAWVESVNTEYKAPLFRLKAVIADKPEVMHIPDGHFYVSFKDEQGLVELGQPVIDPQLIFGQINDFSYPSIFIRDAVLNIPVYQRNENITPCAFGYHTCELTPRQSVRIYSLVGHIESIDALNGLVRTSTNPHYFERKVKENKEVIKEIFSRIHTVSSSREYNLYAHQTFLDNVLRGGLPITFTMNDRKTVFHVFSRKHGDLERDYNKFSVLPTPFSQGNGNFRDVNQNRRNDVWINPDVADSNIKTFINLIQPDGYNPLVIKGSSFTCIQQEKLNNFLKESVKNAFNQQIVGNLLKKPFTPGDVLLYIENNHISLNIPAYDFINTIISFSHKNEESEHGEGFWIDHWTYCIDLIESYVSVFPENLQKLLFDNKEFTFYHNNARVSPRNKRYVLRFGKPFQGYAIAGIEDQEEWRKKEETMQGIDTDIFKFKTRNGTIIKTNLITKLICIVLNKLATLDPSGIGIEMEASKPGWYDALNGLPGLFGSSTNETFELKRLIVFIEQACATLRMSDSSSIMLPAEIYVFLKELKYLLTIHAEQASEKACFEFWDKSNDIKEHYRENIINNFSGDELECTMQELKQFLSLARKKIDLGITKAYDAVSGLYHTYYINEIAEYEFVQDPLTGKNLLSPNNFEYIKPVRFNQKALPLFLEAQVHALGVADEKKAKNIYHSVRRSSLYDIQLKMFKVNTSLDNMPEEIGRCRLFTPGWLENESIWMHMEYKFLLKLLVNGLYDEFYTEFQNVLIPFQDPERYGRSIAENSSFIVSSANHDSSFHGNGFVARLSGCTAEFIHIWLVMNVGKNPFFINDKNELNFKFNPILAGWLFTEKECKETIFQKGEKAEYMISRNAYGFMLLGSTFVIYNNETRKNTFGTDCVKPKNIHIVFYDGKEKSLSGDTLPEEYAVLLRNGAIKTISVELN